MLEFGGGPCIHTLVSAAPYVSEIVFADYAEDNLREVKLWRDKDRTCFDWSELLLQVCCQKNWRGNQTILLQQLIERAFFAAGSHPSSHVTSGKTISLQLGIEGEKTMMSSCALEGAQQLFDVISCSLTIVTTSKTLDEYKSSVN